MTNPFENPDASYHVLRNDEGQYSLWPAFADVPDGWEIALQSTSRAEAMAWVEENWDDPVTVGVAAHD
ncbi:MbtH family protein [Nocardioides zeae]